MFMCDVRSKIKFVTCDVRTPGYILRIVCLDQIAIALLILVSYIMILLQVTDDTEQQYPPNLSNFKIHTIKNRFFPSI